MLNLNTQAQALFKRVQIQADLPTGVEQEIATQSAAAPLDIKQLEKILLTAMPKQKSIIQACCDKVQGYHCDGRNGSFLTQILATRVEKDTIHIERPRIRRAPTVAKDPYFTDLQMAPKADFILLFNARDVDAKGRPLLMKVIARERADLKKIDLSDYRTADGKNSIAKFDVEKVANDADFISVKDTDEVEFTWGDPLKQVTLSPKGKEVSTTVRVAPDNIDRQTFYRPNADGTPMMNRRVRNNTVRGPELDVQNVHSFDDAIHLDIQLKDGAEDGYWLNDGFANIADAGLRVDRGFVFEPGARAHFQFPGVNKVVTVANDDAQLLGAPGFNAPITTNMTFAQLLTRNLAVTTESTATGATDRLVRNIPLKDAIYPNPAMLNVAGASLAPLTTRHVAKDELAAASIKVAKTPLSGDAEKDGQCIAITLGKGFLSAKEEMSTKGYKVVVGYTGTDGKWVADKSKTVRASKTSGEMTFSVEVNDAPAAHLANTNLEVRVYNADGVPAQALAVNFKDIGWAV